MRHRGCVYGVSGQPLQCPPCCRYDEYRYYYDQGRRILRRYSSSKILGEEPLVLPELDQPERIAA
jgi:hypothetical protein